ncbi:MAG: DUF4178 domain-containing protein [Proteobacteria bacterium]|nr:DUF4178 domain-containing protein [Pseudomonadota bacterium]
MGIPNFAHQIKHLKEGDSISFFSEYLLDTDFSGEKFQFPKGPYFVKEVFTHTYSIEYQIQCNDKEVFLEIEGLKGGLLILLQVHMDQEFPVLFDKFQAAWDPDLDHFDLNKTRFHLEERGKSECNNDPYEYFDFYSEEEKKGQKLFIGIENYDSERDILLGYTLPLDAVNLIRST